MDVARGGSFPLRPNWLRLALLVFALAFGGLAHAQSTASLNGTVTDPTGAAVPNAKVTVTNQATGVASASGSLLRVPSRSLAHFH